MAVKMRGLKLRYECDDETHDKFVKRLRELLGKGKFKGVIVASENVGQHAAGTVVNGGKA